MRFPHWLISASYHLVPVEFWNIAKLACSIYKKKRENFTKSLDFRSCAHYEITSFNCVCVWDGRKHDGGSPISCSLCGWHPPGTWIIIKQKSQACIYATYVFSFQSCDRFLFQTVTYTSHANVMEHFLTWHAMPMKASMPDSQSINYFLLTGKTAISVE